MDDDRIVELFLTRDESAIAELSEKYGQKLLRIALAIVADRGSAEECLNDAYLKVWELIPPSEPRDHLVAFIARIVKCTAIDRARRDSAQRRSAVWVELTKELSECLPASDSVEETAAGNELSRTLSGFARSLPEDKRELFVRRYWYFESVEEIALACGMTKSGVKTALHRMRAKLKELLRKEGYGV